MSELFNPLSPELSALLPKGCTQCFLACFTLRQMVNGEVDPSEVARDIHQSCNGWQDEQSPYESILDTEGDYIDLVEIAIDEHCPYFAATS